jgi:hypothetical protein
MKKVVSINFTKPLTFANADCLVEAMGKNLDLMGHLACLDFAELAASSKERRAEFFVISQPGVNFTNVLPTAFTLVDPKSIKRYS